MFHDEKVEKIIQLLEIKPYWKSIELAKEVGTSRSTIQRCLQELQDTGLAERIHGGIKRRDQRISAPIALDNRIKEDIKEKERIADLAITYIPKIGYVYLDAGTTLLPLVSKLNSNSNSGPVYITNDVAIASLLAQRGLAHHLIGGQLHPVTQTLSGSVSLEQMMQYNFELCFISANGIAENGTVACSVVEEAILKRQAVQQSSLKILLASSSKWRKKAPTVISGIESFDICITGKPNAGLKKVCKENNTKFIIGK